MDDTSIKAEPGYRDRSLDDSDRADAKPSYKSWKKKYRKMRLQFDNRMQQSEDLHQLEQKALQTAKRLAIENDRLMDMLISINDSPQIPPERRIDLNVEDEDDETEDEEVAAQKPTKSLRRLIEEVPHSSFAATVEHVPEVLEEIDPKDSELYPTSFLKAEDVDNYVAELDARIGCKTKPAVPPAVSSIPSHSGAAANFALRNPTSVYNWLRRHAPKTFLQDLEKEKDKDKVKERERDHDHSERFETGNKHPAESMDWDEEAGHDASGMGSVRGKRKREDDAGYRPKGGASRPTKKRKSRDLGSSTPRVRKSIP
ncbi:hypothetical protein PG996_013008 [Apiospora saccharicola]|uniref:IEC3 subunit of the Ino80 complex, chromatin re-modelling-domain-containing protein n=1 Tax=Apiospora saccharicola TaxID=335842 RepID=A0ABR1U4T3_9PEZI